MSKSAKIVLLILTLLPLIAVPLVFGVFFIALAAGAHTDMPQQAFIVWSLCIGLIILLTLGLTIFYVTHALTTPRLQTRECAERLLWVLVLIIGGFLAQGAYWYLYIWRDEPITPITM